MTLDRNDQPSPVDLKDGGFIKLKEADYYAVRIRVTAGNLPAESLDLLKEVALKYGRGYLSLTARQGIEIPWVRYKDLVQVKQKIEEAGFKMAGCGPRVRPVVSCKGTVCPCGNIDTQALAVTLDEAFFPRPGFPHKFKMGIAGCPNNCVKSLFEDLGFQGQVEPELHEEVCNLCGLCAAVCNSGAITIDGSGPVRNPDLCIYCGECIRSCPTGAWRAKRTGVAVFVGGKFGKHPRFGDRLADLYPVDKVPDLVEAVMAFYTKMGRPKERLGNVIDRVGLDRLKESIS